MYMKVIIHWQHLEYITSYKVVDSIKSTKIKSAVSKDQYYFFLKKIFILFPFSKLLFMISFTFNWNCYYY